MTDGERDLQRVLPYRDIVAAACAAFVYDPYLLAGIGLRESGFGWAPGYHPKGKPDGLGDGGHAFGLFQIDKRYHASFLALPESQEPINQAGYACALLHDARLYLLRAKLPLTEAKLMEGTLCCYNANERHVLRQLAQGLDPNDVTTDKNYGRWVIAKGAELRRLDPRLFILN